MTVAVRVFTDRRAARRVGITAAVLALVTLVAILVTDGNLIAAVAPTLALLLAWIVTRVPLRYPMLALLFLIFTLDSPVERFAQGKWDSPLYPVAVLLVSQLKKTFPIDALVVSGFEVFVWVILGLHAWRRATHSKLDRDGYVALPRPVIAAAWLSIITILFSSVWGLAQGGEFRFLLWQVQRNINMPVTLFAFAAAFPGPQSFQPYMRMLLVSAHIKAFAAIVLRHYFREEEYVTSHADSMLFAVVTLFLIIRLAMGVPGKEARRTLLSLGFLLWGMVANDRRLVWPELFLSLVFATFMTPRTPLKVRVARAAMVVAPIVALYVAIGWHSSASIFAPVATIRSMVDSKSDGSSHWRDLENFNLVATFEGNPLLGTGYGVEYRVVVPMVDLRGVYELEPYLPHNSVLGVWAHTGYVGYTGTWMLLLVGLYFAARATYVTLDRQGKTATLVAFSAIVVYMLQAYGDIGLGSWISVGLVGPMIVFASKQAVRVGAWSPASASHAAVRRVGEPSVPVSAGVEP